MQGFKVYFPQNRPAVFDFLTELLQNVAIIWRECLNIGDGNPAPPRSQQTDSKNHEQFQKMNP